MQEESMTIPFTVGLAVRVVRLPNLDSDAPDTRDLFQACLNRTFPVVGIDRGFIELEVGDVLGEPAWMHSIYLEPECLEVAGALPE